MQSLKIILVLLLGFIIGRGSSTQKQASDCIKTDDSNTLPVVQTKVQHYVHEVIA